MLPSRGRDLAVLVFDVAALILLLWSTLILVFLFPKIGSTYGGFIWIHDLTMDPPFYVSYFPWRTSQATPFRLQALDHLLSIQGQPPERYPVVYASLEPGTPVRYRVERQGQELTIVEPAHRFSLDTFAVIYGLPYLMLLSTLGAGRALMHSSTQLRRRLLSWLSLLAALAILHFLWAMDTFAGPPVASSYWFPLMALPVPGLGGAILLHSLWLYPRPHPAPKRFRLPAAILYIPPPVLGIAAKLAQLQGPAARTVCDLLIRGQFIYGSGCMLAAGWLALRLWPHVRRKQGPAAWQAFRSLLLVVGILLAGLLGLWWIPFLLTGWPLVPYEILIAMGIVFPLGLVYALSNGDLVQSLERTVQEAQALRQARDQLLHRMADRLHDRVLSQLQGARMLIEGLPRPADPRVARDLDYAVEALRDVVAELRTMLEVTTPMDWSRLSLKDAFAWAVERAARAHPATTIQMETEGYDEADPPRVKEAVYHVLLAALDNALNHGRPSQVRIILQAKSGVLSLKIEDDGVGFDPGEATLLGSERRHQGLSAMQRQATEVGGRLVVHSRPGYGTQVLLEVPRN